MILLASPEGRVRGNRFYLLLGHLMHIQDIQTLFAVELALFVCCLLRVAGLRRLLRLCLLCFVCVQFQYIDLCLLL